MTTVAIICEYNPFHRGHLEQIERIRSLFLGEDVTVLALMSGNFVQRGEPAIFPKTARAEAAVLSGVNLVLELPFPYCMASANYFASSAVSILDRLGVVDYLCFGSESGDISLLNRAADRLCSDAFRDRLDSMLSRDKQRSYATLRAESYRSLYHTEIPKSPNDILGIEYLSALRRAGSSIRPLVLKRESDFSATAARRALLNTISSPDPNKTTCPRNRQLATFNRSEHLPPAMEALADHFTPMTMEAFALPILIRLRTTPIDELVATAEMTGDLAASLKKASTDARTIGELVAKVGGKTYTDARVRRALFFSLLRVGPDSLRTKVGFTRLLGTDESGRTVLRRTAKVGTIQVLSTRPSSPERSEYDLLGRADAVYSLASVEKVQFFREKPFLFSKN